jgi:hypothetical protein
VFFKFVCWIWGIGLALGAASLLAMPAPSTLSDRDRLAEQLVNRLTTLDYRQLAPGPCSLAGPACGAIHRNTLELVASIREAKASGNDAKLKHIARGVDEIETKMDPLLRSIEEIDAKIVKTFRPIP